MGLDEQEYLTAGISFILIGIMIDIYTNSFWFGFPMLFLGLVNSVIGLHKLSIFKIFLKSS